MQAAKGRRGSKVTGRAAHVASLQAVYIYTYFSFRTIRRAGVQKCVSGASECTMQRATWATFTRMQSQHILSSRNQSHAAVSSYTSSSSTNQNRQISIRCATIVVRVNAAIKKAGRTLDMTSSRALTFNSRFHTHTHTTHTNRSHRHHTHKKARKRVFMW